MQRLAAQCRQQRQLQEAAASGAQQAALLAGQLSAAQRHEGRLAGQLAAKRQAAAELAAECDLLQGQLAAGEGVVEVEGRVEGLRQQLAAAQAEQQAAGSREAQQQAAAEAAAARLDELQVSVLCAVDAAGLPALLVPGRPGAAQLLVFLMASARHVPVQLWVPGASACLPA